MILYWFADESAEHRSLSDIMWGHVQGREDVVLCGGVGSCTGQ